MSPASAARREKGLRLGALLWPQMTDWAGFREAALEAERCGFDSLWTSDHLLNPTGPLDGPVLDGWSAITAIGALTLKPTVGLIVSANTLRHPALVAKMTATIDHVTGGRAVCGLGAGWLESEHTVYGIEFGSPADRLDRLGESAMLIRKLLDGERVDWEGRWYAFRSVTQAPAPLQRHLPILIGGEGRRKTLRIVAQVADMWNARGNLESLLDADAALRRHCEEVGRDESTIERLTNRWVVIRDDRRTAEDWVEQSMLRQGLKVFDRSTIICGPPEVVAGALAPIVAAGFRHIVLSLRAPWDMETIRRVHELRQHLSSGVRFN
ncbi:MAG TPA: LLM class flavin-dependent oxidoreductase [Candidatus Dormibacteraeota bacterium]